MTIKPFHTYFYNSSFRTDAEIIRLVAIILQIIISHFWYFKDLEWVKSNITKNLKTILGWVYHQLFLLGLIIAIVIIKKQYNFKDDIVLSGNVTSSTIIADPFVCVELLDLILYLECILLTSTTFALFRFFRINNDLNLIISQLKVSFFKLVPLIIIVLIYILVVAMIFSIQFSSDSERFSSYSKSISQVITMIMGNVDMRELSFINGSWSIFLSIIIFGFHSLFVAAIVIALMVEVNRVLIIKNYYRIKDEPSWLMRDYINFAFLTNLKPVFHMKLAKENN